MPRRRSNQPPPSPPRYWYTENVALTREENKISQKTVQDQLAAAPAPTAKTKSGYPHEFKNKHDFDKPPLFRKRTNSSTVTYHEYPVMANGVGYTFDKKPRQWPGPFRVVTNQNKTFKGVMCHNGDPATGEPTGGLFHRATEHRNN